MKVSEYNHWLKLEWSKVCPILAVYFFLFVFLFVKRYDFVVFLIMLQVPVYLLHQTEEYIFPGGFQRFFNRDVFRLPEDDQPLNINYIYHINVWATWIILPLFSFLSMIDYQWGLWIPYFSIFAGLGHVILGIKAKKIYNPGLIVSLLLNIPIGIWVVWKLSGMGIIDAPFFNLHLLVGFLLNAALPIFGLTIYKRYKKENA